jgi:hypothetical protein
MRVLAIWLDGFDMGLADQFGLPHLAALADRSARAVLDHGTDHLSGLSGEHVATGLDPRAAGRASAVHFDPATYACSQRGTSFDPIYGGVPTVVLDPCYFDLPAAHPDVSGITDWGAHDPGGAPRSRPATLRSEIGDRFGPYPAHRWLYATPWASPDQCVQAGVDLTRAVDLRSEIATWLLDERLPDWELAFVGVSEAHSGTEGLFHGIDPSPVWASCASRDEARRALESVYLGIDRLVGNLVGSFPNAVHVVFSMHGMGPNSSDVPSMVLLGELLRRWSGDETPPLSFEVDPNGLPLLPPGMSWDSSVLAAMGHGPRHRWVPATLRGAGARALGAVRRRSDPESGHLPLGWMPLMRHQPHWARMRAFALPSFYDGRVRVNVRGREGRGCVDPTEYGPLLDEVEALLADCRDPITGEAVVESTTRPFDDPGRAGPTDADLIVTWRPGVLGFRHPGLGTVGPVPPRRTGGHTSPIGRLLVHGQGVTPQDLGTRSSFDVVPTLIALSGSVPVREPSGRAIDLPGVANRRTA